jgi:pimeloyl-ACP methyl ester carboxylesterase
MRQPNSDRSGQGGGVSGDCNIKELYVAAAGCRWSKRAVCLCELGSWSMNRLSSKSFAGVLLAVSALLGSVATAPALAQAPSATAELARGGWLGTALDGSSGQVRITSVNPMATSGRIGIEVGDELVSFNGTAVTTSQQAVALVQASRAGQPVRVVVRRGGTERTLRGTMVGRPLEEFAGATVTYGAVPWGGGQLRSIMVMPTTRAQGNPVVYFVQGASCFSVESTGPTDAYARFVEGLVREGIAVYRVEKAGMGDSAGSKHCNETDYEEELSGFEAGYRALTQTHGVTPEQLFIFGHSMGGIQAPRMVARGASVRGIAVFGVGMSPWLDYLQDLYRWQPVMQGATPQEAEALSEELRPLINALLTDPAGAAAIAARSADNAALMREHMAWDGGDRWMGRASAYWRGVAAERSAQAWSTVRTPVLVFHGGKDLAVVDDRGARRIAAMANMRRPGSGTYVELPDTAHNFSVGVISFDPNLSMQLVEWIKAVVAPVEVDARRLN